MLEAFDIQTKSVPTFYFIGVTTGKSSIMKVFPLWMQILGRPEIVIEGTPRVALSGSPEIPGGIATTALAVNLIPHVLAAQPGLVSAIDLPVPAALLGDARRAVERLRRGAVGEGGSGGP